MSIVKSIALFCDDCGDWTEPDRPTVQNAKQTRKQAKGWGWKNRGGKDYCPDCEPPDAERGEEN